MAAEDFFKIGGADRGHDELSATRHRGTITIEIEEPWAGSTETGFGQSCSHSLSPEEARSLAQWLIRASLAAEAEQFVSANPGASLADYLRQASEG